MLNYELYKNKLLFEKELIIEAIQNFKSNLLNFIKTRDLKSEEQIKQLQSIHVQINNDKLIIEKSLNYILNKEKKHLIIIEHEYEQLIEIDNIIKQQQDKLTSISEQMSQMSQLSNIDSKNFVKISEGEDKKQNLMIEFEQNKAKLSEFKILLKTKQDGFDKLNESIQSIFNSLNELQDYFNKEQIEKIALQNFKFNCLTKILEQKEIIITKIKDYTQKWIEWIDKNKNIDNKEDKIDYIEIKIKLKDDFLKVLNNFKYIINVSNDYVKEKSEPKDNLLQQIKNNINDIKMVIQKCFVDQLVKLNGLKKPTEILEIKPNESVKSTIEKLNNVKNLLCQTNDTIIPKEIDYNNYLAISKKYKNISNSFVRKQQIIKYLNDIIGKNIIFNNLPDSTKIFLQNYFNLVKNDIDNYLKFLNFSEYNNNFTLKQASPDFCNKIIDILDYWDLNIECFRKQDLILTNIYEDLSNVVKIFIQYEGTSKADCIITNKDNKILLAQTSKVELNNISGIFDDKYSNLFIYTGLLSSHVYLDKVNKFKINNFIEKSDTFNPGLFHSLKQLEDNYSIVIFENSGANFFFGNYQTQEYGILHYLLNTLENVKNIKIKNIFEQTLDLFKGTLPQLTSRLINIVNKLPSQFKDFVIDENNLFDNFLENKINFNNFTFNDLFNLSETLYKHRLNKNRIKKILNKDSYRSNLFIIFEISFTNGFNSYLTICQLASLLNPKDTIKQFSNTNVNFEQIFNYKNFDLKSEINYTKEFIIDILKESFYINETFNHLSYFLNKKSFKTNILKKVDSFSSFNKSEFFVLPIDKSGNGEEILINKNNNCLTVPILKFLDKISNINSDIFKPTKFLVLNKINCEENIDLVDFIQKINLY